MIKFNYVNLLMFRDTNPRDYYELVDYARNELNSDELYLFSLFNRRSKEEKKKRKEEKRSAKNFNEELFRFVKDEYTVRFPSDNGPASYTDESILYRKSR